MTPEQTKQPERSPMRRKRIMTSIRVLIFSLFVIATVAGVAFAHKVTTIIQNTPEFKLSAFSDLASPTLIYDRNGALLTEMRTQDDRELIKNVRQVSPNLAKAFVAAEDKEFYHHIGVNPVAIARAVVQDLVSHRAESGASTITQQTVKLVIFPGQERTLQRKIQEAVLAIRLEKVLTKDEILTDYMNWIYFGKMGDNNVYGVVRASQTLFGKSPTDLNLAQSAFLAAIPNNPSLFSPYDQLTNTITRQHYVLNNMQQLGFISKGEYRAALAFDVKGSILKASQQTAATAYGQYPFVNDEVKQKAMDILLKTHLFHTADNAEEALSTGGYKIYTTIDTRAQQAMQTAIADKTIYNNPISYDVPDGKGGTTHVTHAWEQAGATLIDNATGGVLAIGGGRDFHQDQNNHTELWRQPGSSIKPLADYGPAIQLHLLSPASVIDDVPMQWPDQNATNGKYFPLNWDKQFHGLVTAREALYESYNIPALKVFMNVHPDVGLGYLEKMGITTLTPEDKQHVAAGIGGLVNGLTVEQATSAYTTFPNQGVWRDGFLISKIVNRDGAVVYQHQATTHQVFSPQAAYLMTDMMRDVVKKGTASYYVGRTYSNLPVAGKTGTTDGNKDAWFIGFTPRVTLGVWGGYDIPNEMTQEQSHHPQVLWDEIMAGISKVGYPVDGQFEKPSGIVQLQVSTKSGLLPSDLAKQAGYVTTDLFIQGTEPHTLDNVLVKAKYVVIGGVKYLASPSSPPGEVKEGIFIKRAPYELPDGNKSYLPWDYQQELPRQVDPRGKSSGGNSGTIPANLQVTDSTPSSVTLHWATVGGAHGYIVLRSTAMAGPYRTITPKDIPDISFRDGTVHTGTTYYYEVESIDQAGHPSAPSTAVTAVAGGSKPASPQNIKITNAAVGVAISWDPVAGANTYVIARGDSADGPFTPLAEPSAATYTDVGALPGATYTYQITASGPAGDSSPAKATYTVSSDGR